MASKPKFHSKKAVVSGGAQVETGFKSNQVKFRFRSPGGMPVTLTYAEAYDLADALDQALAEQETSPLV